MKIYILTFVHAHNHGALLQCYALQKSIQEIVPSADVKVINYWSEKERFLRKVSFSKFGIKSLLFNLSVFYKYPGFKKAFDRFEAFHLTRIEKTEHFTNYNDVCKFANDGDIYIVGSDQVWNFCFNENEKVDNYYMLDWVSSNNPLKYTYAVSLGVYRPIPEKAKDFFDLAKKFDMISVREKDVAEHIKSVSDVNCRVDIDPVFLLNKDYWVGLFNSEREIKYEYVFVFELVKCKDMQEKIDVIKRKYNLPVVLLTRCIDSKIKADKIIYDSGPEQFLSLIYYSSVVLTTSFHATAFSIIFNKDFYVLLSNHAPGRMKNLLSMIGLEDRIISSNDIKNEHIDYSVIQEKLKMIIDDSKNYLKSIVIDR